MIGLPVRPDIKPNPGGPLSVGLVVGGPIAREGHGPCCGVGDYSACLAQALQYGGVDARVMAPDSWHVRDGLAFIRAFRPGRHPGPLDVLHLQYPSIGHRRSLLPHLLGLTGAGRRFVVTLHEHSALPRVQRAANRLFRTTADRIVFTTDHEAKSFGASSRSPIIPIGSNVPTHPDNPPRDNTVLYFGQIRPDKGIETFIELAELSGASGNTARFVVVGSTPPRWRDYHQALRAAAPSTMVWVEDAPLPVAARMMATALAAFLPFPDGAGLRRGSLMAALSNGLPVIAPFGRSTTPELRMVLLPADTAAAALDQLRALQAFPSLGRQYAAAGRALTQRFGWTRIAEQHVSLYRSLLTERMAGARQPATLATTAGEWGQS